MDFHVGSQRRRQPAHAPRHLGDVGADPRQVEQPIRRAIRAGVTKVNVNTELREAYLETTAVALNDVRDGHNLLELHRRQTEATRTVVAAKLAQYDLEG